MNNAVGDSGLTLPGLLYANTPFQQAAQSKYSSNCISAIGILSFSFGYVSIV